MTKKIENASMYGLYKKPNSSGKSQKIKNVELATKNRDLIELTALHVSNLFQARNGFLPDEQQQLMDMLLTLNVMNIRQDKIIKRELNIGDEYLWKDLNTTYSLATMTRTYNGVGRTQSF